MNTWATEVHNLAAPTMKLADIKHFVCRAFM